MSASSHKIYQPLLGMKLILGVPEKMAYSLWLVLVCIGLHAPSLGLLASGVALHGVAALLASKDPHIFFFLWQGLFPKRLEP